MSGPPAKGWNVGNEHRMGHFLVPPFRVCLLRDRGSFQPMNRFFQAVNAKVLPARLVIRFIAELHEHGNILATFITIISTPTSRSKSFIKLKNRTSISVQGFQASADIAKIAIAKGKSKADE